MRYLVTSAITALFLASLAACEKPAPPGEPAAAAPADLPPAAAVPEASILKAAEIHMVLHDADLDAAQKEDRVGTLLKDSGWTEKAYRDLLFDIAAHPASRARYVRAIE